MDRYRNIGPANTVRPLPLQTNKLETIFQNTNEQLRRDGRPAHSIRPIFLQTNVIPQANGSAYIEIGNSKVFCSVYGPRPGKRSTTMADRGQLECDFKFSPFACEKRRGYRKDAQEREFTTILQQCLAPAIRLELFPKSTIDVFVNVVQNDGTMACLAAAVTCASMALADAGIEMFDLVAGCSGGFFGADGFCLDVDLEEEALETGSLMIAYMPSLNEITHVLETGQIEANEAISAIDECVDAAQKVHGLMADCLRKAITEENAS